MLHYKKTPLPWFQELINIHVQVKLVKGDQKLSQVSVLWVDDGMKDKDDGSVNGGKTVREIWRPQVVAAIYTNFNIGICVGRGRQTSDLNVTISTLISDHCFLLLLHEPIHVHFDLCILLHSELAGSFFLKKLLIMCTNFNPSSTNLMHFCQPVLHPIYFHIWKSQMPHLLGLYLTDRWGWGWEVKVLMNMNAMSHLLIVF